MVIATDKNELYVYSRILRAGALQNYFIDKILEIV